MDNEACCAICGVEFEILYWWDRGGEPMWVCGECWDNLWREKNVVNRVG